MTHIRIHKFPTLYSRASTGKPQQWTIIVNDDHYWTESGQVGGAITKSAPTFCKGKNLGKINETTPHEQAMKDAQSKFDKQLKSNGYFENIEEIDNISFLQPMLAKNYGDRKAKIKWPMIVQCKLNGGRCIATRDGLWTRKGERILSVPHIETALKPIFDKYPDAYIDGELFNYDLRQKLNEIMKLIRRTVNLTDEHFKKSKEEIRFYVYDGYGFGEGFGQKIPYIVRKTKLDELINGLKEFCVTPLQQLILWNEDELDVEYQKLLADEQEGAILREVDGGYEHKRSWNLLKYKPVDDAEFLLLDVSEGEGDWAGKAKIVHLQMDDGRKFNGSFKGTMEEAAKFLAEKNQYIGKKYTCYFNGFTGLGIPNYAIFCINNSIERNDEKSK
jgi:DNA ligase-1